MKVIFNIAKNEINLAIHNKLVFLFLLFSLIIIPLMNIFDFFNIEQEMKILKDFSFSIVSIMGIILSVFYPILSVKEDFDKKYIFNILSKPVSRFSYILGKYLGTCIIITLISATNFLLLYVLLKTKNTIFSTDEIMAAGILLGKFYLLVSVSIFLGLLSFSFQVSSMISVFFYIVGTIKVFILTALRYTQSSAPVKVLEIFLKMFPNFQFFDAFESVMAGTALTGKHTGRIAGYAATYIFLFLFLAWLAIRRKEI